MIVKYTFVWIINLQNNRTFQLMFIHWDHSSPVYNRDFCLGTAEARYSVLSFADIQWLYQTHPKHNFVITCYQSNSEMKYKQTVVCSHGLEITRHIYNTHIFLTVGMFDANFSNIAVMLCWSVLLVEETGVSRENYKYHTSHRQTLSHMVIARFHCNLLIYRTYFQTHFSANLLISAYFLEFYWLKPLFRHKRGRGIIQARCGQYGN